MPYRLLLFDIDGTLMLTGGAGSRCLQRAGQTVFGKTFQWLPVTAGALDPEIYRQLVEPQGIDDPDAHHDAFRDAYLQHLADELPRIRRQIRVMPGIHALLNTLEARDDVIVGLLSGNYAQAAHLKLQAAGIDPQRFPIRALGEDAPTRPELISVALRRCREITGQTIQPRQTLIIGDTPRDVDCARAHGAGVLAVATGRYNLDQLKAAGADHAVTDLADPEPLLNLLDAEPNT